MNSEILVNILGSILVDGRDNSPLGVDSENDFRQFHKSLQYFNYNRLVKEIEGIIYWRPKGNEIPSFNQADYIDVLRHIYEKEPERYGFQDNLESKGSCILDIMTVPRLEILVNGNKCCLAIPVEESYDEDPRYFRCDEIGLTAAELKDFIPKIDGLLTSFTKEVVSGGMKSLVPADLQDEYLGGMFTKDMGHSIFGDGSYSIGHEIRLRCTDSLDFVYAYIPDYFWQESCMERTFDNVSKVYGPLLMLAQSLPDGVEFKCQHRNDCGVDLTENAGMDDDVWMRKAIRMVRKDRKKGHFDTKDCKDIMEYCGLTDRISLADFRKKAEEEIERMDRQEYRLRQILGPNANKITIDLSSDRIYLYLLTDRDSRWDRECCLVFSYETDFRFLEHFDQFLKISQDLTALFEKSWDIETSVGLLRHID